MKDMIHVEVLSPNFLDVFHFLDLEYNFFSVDSIEKADSSIWVRNRKIPVFDNENNIAQI